MKWDQDLDGPALRIAATNHSPLRVIAGPGTGKTFALMRRVTRLLEQGVSPKRILVVTFTRTAARDLQQEIKELGVGGADKVKARTLHSFCFGLLGREEVFSHTERIPRPLLGFEEKFLLQDLAGGQFGGVRDCTKRLAAFNADWARLQTDEPGWPSDPTDRAFHLALQQWLKFHGAMLIGEIVPVTLEYLRDNPLSGSRETFDHVIVDEYQDLNRAEQELLDLVAEGGSLAVVGDEDQSIYSFKHAHPEGIASFAHTHDNTHDEALGACRRCPRLVIDMANHLIANNQARQPRVLEAMTGCTNGEIHVVQWGSMEAEAEGIARFIKARIQAGEVEPGRALVLAPRRQFGYAIRDALNRLQTPAHSFFHEEALEGNPKQTTGWEPQEAFTLLTLLADPNDAVALRCWCGFGSSTLRSNPWNRLRVYCEDAGLTPHEALERITAGEVKVAYTTGLVPRFQALEAKLEGIATLKGRALLDAVLPDSEEWAEPLRILAEDIDDDETSAEDLRELLRVAISQPELPLDVDYVRVMSLHKSKGLTVDMVVVAGCIQGLIPHTRRDGSQAEQQRSMEEQRRLFYVVLTRTRQTLVLSSVASLPRDLAHLMGAHVPNGYGRTASTIASQFLRELGPSKPRAVAGDVFLQTLGLPEQE
ncbi:MAG: ATP-dependent helicase [Thermoanaerobaculales bacterium]|nr:ATP-dependent helicase [Thermoanaerobaculales bacterium]